MVGGASCNKSHRLHIGPRRLQVWTSIALGITLLLLSMAAATLLVSAKTGAVHKPVSPSQVLSPAQSPPQMARMTTVNAAGSFSAPITTTALLPIMVNGYPPPYAWTGEIVATYPNCTLTRLFGFVLNQYGEPEGDVWVHYWADNSDDGWWTKSSWEITGDRNWDGTVDIRPRHVLWYACVVPGKKSWDCQSNTVEAPTSANCEKGIQVYHIDFRQN